MIKKILFICKHNRFRSKVAEAIFNKLNKNKEIKAESRGVLLDKLRPYPSRSAQGIVRKKGYSLKGKPQKLKRKDIENADIIIIVANNLGRKLFNNFKGKILKWYIEDADALDLEKVRRVIDKIETEVKKLVSGLKN